VKHHATTLILFPLLWISFAATALDKPADPPSNTKEGYHAFQIILDRNIFDPNRIPKGDESVSFEPEEEPPSTPMETINLVGVILNDNHALAFFSGSRSEYNTRAGKGDAIAGFKLAAIDTRGVLLKNGKGEFDLPVGSGLARTEGTRWNIVRNAPSRGINRQGESDHIKESPPEPSKNQGPGDLLKKLMERRKQEISQ